MKHYLILILFLNTATIFGQNLTPCFDYDNRLYGYCDEKGEVAIKHQYFQAGEFINGYAIVQKDSFRGPTGVINAQNEVFIPFDYTMIFSFKNQGFILEKDSLKVGILSPSLETILPFYQTFFGIPFAYNEHITKDKVEKIGFSVLQNGKMDYVLDGRVLFDFEYDSLAKETIYLEDGEKFHFFLVRKGEQWKVIDKNNQLINDLPEFDVYHGCWSTSEQPFYVVRKDGEILFYNLLSGEILTDIRNVEIHQNVPAKVIQENGLYGLLAPDGNMALPLEYDHLYPMMFYPNLFVASKDELWGIVNAKGEIQNEFAQLVRLHWYAFSIDGISCLSPSDAYLIQKDGKMAMYFANGKQIFPFRYESLGMLKVGDSYEPDLTRIFAGNKGQIRIYDLDENPVSDFLFEEIYGIWSLSQYTIVKHEGQIKYYDLLTDQLLEEFEDEFKKYAAVANNKGFYGLFDSKGNQYLPSEYDDIGVYEDAECVVKKDGEDGLMDLNGPKTAESIDWEWDWSVKWVMGIE